MTDNRGDGRALLELAERVEAATGPDRELNRLIAVANGWCLHPPGRQRDDSVQSDTGFTCLDCGADSWGNTGPTGQKRSASIPAYTASLDAAMTLVPEGWNWMAGARDQPRARAYVNNGELAFVGVTLRRNPDRRWFEVTAATPALALTAAALRALAATKDNQHAG